VAILVFLIWKYESPILLKFLKSIWKNVVPYAEWLHLVLHSTSLKNIIIPDRKFLILIWKYLVDIRSDA
jgi:hypothetical protein